MGDRLQAGITVQIKHGCRRAAHGVLRRQPTTLTVDFDDLIGH
jgi:hypothetical protein